MEEFEGTFDEEGRNTFAPKGSKLQVDRRLAVTVLFVEVPCIPKFENHLRLNWECGRDPSLGT